MTTNGTAAKSNNKLFLLIAMFIAVICLCLCVVASVIGFFLWTRDSGPTVPPTALVSQQPIPAADPQSQTWLVMFYFDADDAVLEEDMYFDLNEVEMVGSTDRVRMVAQIDRSAESYQGDGNWTSARRYFLTRDNDLNAINSQLLDDLGEVDMGSADTLVDFATWAIQAYPSDKYVLIMSDHGAGWPGGWSDENPRNSSGNWIFLNDLERALGQIIANTGIQQFELVGMDACLMSMLEVYNGLSAYSHFAVASQETEPALGWAYAAFLGDLAARPEMSGADLARAIVDSYIVGDLRILDDGARQGMLSSLGYQGTTLTAEQVAQEWGTTITISALDLSALAPLNAALDGFLYALKNVDQSRIAEARSYAQAFYNVFDSAYPSPYIDLGNFAGFVSSLTGDPAVSQSLLQLQAGISRAVIAEKHGAQRPGASGISIHFPVSDIYWDENTGYIYYNDATRTSASLSLWDDFLAFHYAGQDFGLGNPSRGSRLPAPGSGEITIAPLAISPASINTDGTLNIQTDISGENVAYVYLVGLLKHSSENGYLAFFLDYLMVDESQAENGVVYPLYSLTNDKIHIDVDWNLSANAVCDDDGCFFALVNPDQYAARAADLFYFVEGWYIYADTGKRVEASIYFYNQGENLIRNIIANPPGDNAISSPNALIPRPGDQFLTVNTVLIFDNSGKFTTEYQEGNLLTFGELPFNYGSFSEPDPGQYLVGVMVKDMDGGMTWQFAPVTVK